MGSSWGWELLDSGNSAGKDLGDSLKAGLNSEPGWTWNPVGDSKWGLGFSRLSCLFELCTIHCSFVF